MAINGASTFLKDIAPITNEVASKPSPSPTPQISSVGAVVKEPDSINNTAEIKYAAQIEAKGGANFSKRQIEELVQALNEFLSRNSFSISFAIDKDTDELVIKVVDRQTGELIKQIPSEDVLRLSKTFDELAGILVNHKA